MEANQVKSWFKIICIAILAFLSGYFIKSLSTETKEPHQASEKAVQKWTCSMHPEIIRDKPGRCPKCGMELVPLVTEGEVNEFSRQLVLSSEAAALMEIETSVVERRFAEVEVRMTGKLDYDETRIKNITARVPGRIDRLFVDFTGITVKKDDHLVSLYSPELISAQAELGQAVKAFENLKPESSDTTKKSALNMLEAAREKLRLLGLLDEQIKAIEKSETDVTHVTIFSPIGGVVIEKDATEGMYVDTGTIIYKVADLSRLWAKLDVYESDLVWIRYGQQADITTEAYPGQIFTGTISFIDPVLDDATRTIKARVNIDNSDGRLRPSMFVKAVVHSKAASEGKVMDPNLAGKWICPMHPDIIKPEAGTCDICGMKIVTAESLGYVKAEYAPPLVIPATAPLITGKRAIVYVHDPNAEKPTFEGREIVLGPKAGDFYIVRDGLKDGELIVTKGAFRIDAALQLQAKPSMMNPKPRSAPAVHIHEY